MPVGGNAVTPKTTLKILGGQKLNIDNINLINNLIYGDDGETIRRQFTCNLE